MFIRAIRGKFLAGFCYDSVTKIVTLLRRPRRNLKRLAAVCSLLPILKFLLCAGAFHPSESASLHFLIFVVSLRLFHPDYFGFSGAIRRGGLCLLGLGLLNLMRPILTAAELENPANAKPEAPVEETIFINEYRVDGARTLPRRAVEEAVYSYLGPGRTQEDVELARAALEQAYAAQGFQTVAVQIPPQQPAQVKRGIIHLQVVERTVGRLRVKGARYSSPKQIKAMTPSLAEGEVIDFKRVPGDLVVLNQLPDRQVTPSLRAGVEPDTVDVDLDVKEKAPVHAGLQVDNRHGPNTTPLRLTGSVSANNLFQSGQGAGLTYQTSPQKTSEVKVFSGYYLARFRSVDWLTLMLNGTKQDSDVSTLGSAAVAGRGTTVGFRAMFALPGEKEFSQSASAGLDYKHFDQSINLAPTSTSPASTIVTPITYFPVSANYGATWQGKRATTEFTGSVTFHLRGVGSNTAQFNNSRYNADGSFLYFHGDLAHTRELPAGMQLYGKIQGQLADQPLLSGEQFAGGGLGTARGYLEGEQVGDSGVFGTVELRSPPLAWLLDHRKDNKSDWRIYAFYDAGWLKAIDALAGQKNHFDFFSYGAGSRWMLWEHCSGSIDASVPLNKVGPTKAKDTRVTFKAAFDY